MSHHHNSKKRKLSHRGSESFAESMGATIARIREEQDADGRASDSSETKGPEDGQQSDNKGEWQEVDRVERRKRKKLEKNQPDITHSATSRLQSFVKISDLQNLVLYLLADGTAPQWCSVRHHQNFEKVVVVMVPGLDAALFDGTVELDDSATDEVSKHGEEAQQTRDPPQASNNVVDGAPTSPKAQKMRLAENDFWPSKLAYQKLPGPLKPLVGMFGHLWQIKTPGEPRKMHSPMYAMLSSPIPRQKEDKSGKGAKPPAEGRSWVNQRTPITEYVATKQELFENGYSLHPAHLHSDKEREAEAARRHKAVRSPEDGWVDILDITSVIQGAAPDAEIEAGSILQGRQLVIIDCEMVTTTADRFALARVSLIDWDGNTILDELVKPPDEIKDYLTPFSGITKEMMDGATLTLPDIQAKLREILTPRSILAGHSLDSDFRALKMTFPFVVDTALLYPHPKGPPQKSSLKWLTQKYLGREIQKSSATGHDSVEDAKACLDLIKQKCEKGKAWGTGEASGESIFKRLARTGKEKQENRRPSQQEAGNHTPQNGSTETNGSTNGEYDGPPKKTGAIVDWTGNMHGFAATANVAIQCASDAEVTQGVVRAVNGSSAATASEPIPPSGCDFTFARLRELEFLRGWTPSAASKATPADSNGSEASYGPTNSALSAQVAATMSHLVEIHEALPPRTAFIVLSGSGDPREMLRMQAKHAAHKAEFMVKKWDELEQTWTDVEEQALRKATEAARRGVGFIGVTG